MKKVIFACVHNAGRSQMAAAIFNQLADPNKATAHSAGTNPSEKVHEIVITAMKEVGIDLSQIKPRFLDKDLASQASLLITMGCKENCPYVPGLKILDWPLEDPKDKPIETVRKIRDEIKQRVLALIHEIGF